VRTPIFVRPLTDAEREALTGGLRSKDTYVLRRCEILLASAPGERAPRIAIQAGQAAARTKDTYLAAQYRRLAARRGSK
jgi:hypothetical protein